MRNSTNEYRSALKRAVAVLSDYAAQLNKLDGGKRPTFKDYAQWLAFVRDGDARAALAQGWPPDLDPAGLAERVGDGDWS